RIESCGNDHARSKGATTIASLAFTPPTVSLTARGTATGGRDDGGQPIRAPAPFRAGSIVVRFRTAFPVVRCPLSATRCLLPVGVWARVSDILSGSARRVV